MAQGVASGTWEWKPALSEWVIECFERIQVRPSALVTDHIISARRSMNLVLQTEFANNGIDLWEVDQVCIPLTPRTTTFLLPENTIDLLDSYIRTYQPGGNATTLGNALVPMLTGAGVPMVTGNGDPMLLSPGSGTLSSVAGSAEILLMWPGNGLAVGDPIFFGCPVSVGDIYLSGLYVVSRVVDFQTIAFMAPTAAVITQALMGATPLFATTAGSEDVQVIIPNHGQAVGNNWAVEYATTIGGLAIAVGAYEIVSVQNEYTFTIQPGGAATATTAEFENAGQIPVSTQAENQFFEDILVYPISRNDYAALPNKYSEGRPTSYWFDRQIVPRINIWPLTPAAQPAQGITPVFSPPSTNAANAANPNFYYAFIGYRFREVMDANPDLGEVLDAPKRLFGAFTALLTAALAEKFNRALWAEKLAYAKVKMDEAFPQDREKVSTQATPDLTSYYR